MKATVCRNRGSKTLFVSAVQRMMIQVVQELSSESFLLYRKQPWRGLRVNVGIRLRRGTTSVFSGKGTAALVLLYRKEVSKPVW